MNSVLVLFVIIGCAFAQQARYRPQPTPVPYQQHHFAIVRQSSDISPDGSYVWGYETENGISAQEQGALKNVNAKEPAIEAQGSFAYTAPDGTPIGIKYIANENGFQPQGAHLPVAPEIPPAILRALAYIAAHPQPEETYKPVRKY